MEKTQVSETIEVKVARVDERTQSIQKKVDRIEAKIDDLSEFKMKIIGACILLPFVFSLILKFF